MIGRFRHPAPPAPRNRGFALIAFVLLLVLVAGYVVAAALNRTGSELSSSREDRNMNALRQAKAALIAYVASEQWQNTGGVTPFQPGAFPCPDRDGNGVAEDHEFPQKPCDTSLKRIGRFPWKTVGADNLRDASGEPLWYAVSANFLKNTPLYTNIINSDTQGQLKVTGPAPANNLVASNVVAILFAPGLIVQNQSRDPTNAVAYNDPANYLEQFNLATNTFISSTLPSDTLNDRLLIITQADVMSTVELVAAANIERDIKPYVQNYFTDWGTYPFPAPFAAPDPGRSQLQYTGSTAGDTHGLLPLTTDYNFAGWQTSSASVTQIAGGTGSSTVTSWSCSSSTVSQIVCRIDYSGGLGDRAAIQLQATLRNVASSFLRPVVQSDKTMTDSFGNTIDWSASTPTFTPTVSNALSPAPSGDAVVTLRGRLRSASTTGNRVFIRIPASYYPITDSADPQGGWFTANQWYRETYYAVSPGFLHLVGSTNACNPLPGTPPSCLKVNKLPLPSDNKRAILVLAGRALNGASRPTSSLPAYFENANLTAANDTVQYVYEQRIGTPTAINDRVVVLAP